MRKTYPKENIGCHFAMPIVLPMDLLIIQTANNQLYSSISFGYWFYSQYSMIIEALKKFQCPFYS